MSGRRSRQDSLYEDRERDYSRQRPDSFCDDHDSGSYEFKSKGERSQQDDVVQAEEDLYNYLLEFDMSHNFERLREHGLGSIEALLRASSDDLERIGILKGNAIFIARHLQTLYGSYETMQHEHELGMMDTANDLGITTIDQADLFGDNGELRAKYQFDAPFDKLKLKRRIGNFAFGSLWEVVQEENGKSIRRAVKVQASNSKTHIARVRAQIDTWCRALERRTSNVPYILDTKELPNVVLILMEYTPSMPVDTAHEYLTKIMDKGKALKRMRETASELLPVLARFLKDLHSTQDVRGKKARGGDRIFLRDSDNPETYKEQKRRGVLTNNILVRFDSMGNLAGTWIIDFTWAQIRDSRNTIKPDDIGTDWGDLLFSFLVLYRNSNMLVAADKGKVDVDRLEKELKKCCHINDVTEAINKIQKKHGNGKTLEDIEDLITAARERDVELTSRDMRGIVFGADGTVIGFRPQHDKSSRKDGAFNTIVFARSFMKEGVAFTNSERKYGYAIKWTDSSDEAPRQFQGSVQNGFVCVKGKRQWRITVTGTVFELFEEFCLDASQERTKTPFLILRVDTKTRGRSSNTYKNVWYMPGGGSDAECATFAFTHQYEGVCFFYFEFHPESIDVDPQYINYEYDDPAPSADLGVAIGWKPVKVNGKAVKDVRKFIRELPSGHITFVKPEPQPCLRRLCGSEMQLARAPEEVGLDSEQLALKIYAGHNGHVVIWENRPRNPEMKIKYIISENSFRTNNEYSERLQQEMIDVIREGCAYASNQWNGLGLGITFEETDKQERATISLQSIYNRDTKQVAISPFPYKFGLDGKRETIMQITQHFAEHIRSTSRIKKKFKQLYHLREYDILTHEFGHVLGIRHEDCRSLIVHEHNLVPGKVERSTATWLGEFVETKDGGKEPNLDPDSIMRSHIDGKFNMSERDKANFKALYDLADGGPVGDLGFMVSRRDPRRARDRK